MQLVISPMGNVSLSCGFTADEIIPSAIRTAEQLVPHVKNVSHRHGYFNLKANNFTAVRVRYFCTNFYEKTNGERTCPCAVTFARANSILNWTVIETHNHSTNCANKRFEHFKADIKRAFNNRKLTLDTALDFTKPIPSHIINILVQPVPSQSSSTKVVKKHNKLSSTPASFLTLKPTLEVKTELGDDALAVPPGNAFDSIDPRFAIDFTANKVATTTDVTLPCIVINLRGRRVTTTSTSAVTVLRPVNVNNGANKLSIAAPATSSKRHNTDVDYNTKSDNKAQKPIKIFHDEVLVRQTYLAQPIAPKRKYPATTLASALDEQIGERNRRDAVINAPAEIVTRARGQKRTAPIDEEEAETTYAQRVKHIREALALEIKHTTDAKTGHPLQHPIFIRNGSTRKPKHVRSRLAPEHIRYGLAGYRIAVPSTSDSHEVSAEDSGSDDISVSGRFDAVPQAEYDAKAASYAAAQLLLRVSATPFEPATATSAVRHIMADDNIDINYPVALTEIESAYSDDEDFAKDVWETGLAPCLLSIHAELQDEAADGAMTSHLSTVGHGVHFKALGPMTSLLAAVDDAVLFTKEHNLDADLL